MQVELKTSHLTHRPTLAEVYLWLNWYEGLNLNKSIICVSFRQHSFFMIC